MKNYLTSLITLIVLLLNPIIAYSEEEVLSKVDKAKIQKGYDHSAIDDYILSRLYQLDTKVPGYLYRGLTMIYLTDGLAVSQIRQQTQSLQQTIDKSYESIALDESLRRQISRLAESVHIIDGWAKRPSKELITVRFEALSALEKGLARYTAINKKMENYLENQQGTLRNRDEIVMQKVAQLAADKDKIIKNATAFEKVTHSQSWTKIKDACGATARALLFYFYSNDLLVADFLSSVKNPSEGVDSLIEHLKENHKQTGTGHLYYVDVQKLDHVFIILQTTKGKYRILQSFIDEYSLLADLTDQNREMSYEEIMQFTSRLKQILNAKEWDQQVATLYKDLFLTYPKDYVKKEFSNHESKISFLDLVYKN